jgi:hypothetical protein
MALTVPTLTTVSSKDNIVTYTYDTGTNLTEKIDGVTMNSIPSAEGTSRTMTISQAQWDSLSFGDHTLEITMGGAPDTVVTRTFKKVTAPTMKLPELTKAVTDLAPLHASWKSNLVDKLPSLDASGTTNEPFNVLINRIPDGLSWKDALVGKLPLLDAGGTNAETLSALINKVPDGLAWKNSLVGKLPSLDATGTNAETLTDLINKVPDGLVWKNQVVAKLPSLDATGTNSEPLTNLIGKVPNGMVWKDALVSKLGTLTIPASNSEAMSELIGKIPTTLGSSTPQAGDTVSQNYRQNIDDTKVWAKNPGVANANWIAVDNFDNIYVAYGNATAGSVKLAKYDPDLNLIWSKTEGTATCLKVYVKSGFVYAVYSGSYSAKTIRKLAVDGTEQWWIAGPSDPKCLDVDKEDGKIYIGCATANYIWCLNPDGTKSWSSNSGVIDVRDICIDYTLSTATGNAKTLIVAQSNTAISRCYTTEQTTYRHRNTALTGGYTEVFVSKGGIVYGRNTSGGNNYIYGFNPDLTLYQSVVFNVINPCIGQDDNIYHLIQNGTTSLWRRLGFPYANKAVYNTTVPTKFDSSEAPSTAMTVNGAKQTLAVGNYFYILYTRTNTTDPSIIKFNNKVTYV